MKKANLTLTKGLGVALLCVGANVAVAETVNVPATVSVNNAIDFQFTGTLDFGILRATADETLDECAILGMAATPATPTLVAVASGAGTLCTVAAGDAVIQSVGGTPTRPEFTVTGVTPFTNLVLTIDPTPITLVGAALPGDAATFSVGNFSVYRTSGITPGAVSLDGSGVGSLASDSAGNAAFRVGAQIATHVAAIDLTPVTGALNYQDGVAYSGSFDVEVTY